MKKPDTNSPETITSQLMKLEESMRLMLNQLSATDRLSYLNGMIARMYNTPKITVSAPEKIRLVIAHRKGNTLTATQQEQLQKLSDLTNQLYDLENGNNE